MAITVHQMLAFSDDLNERWFPWLAEQDPELLTANVECSFYTPLGVLTHIGNVEATWQDVIEGGQPAFGDPPHSTKAFETVEPVLGFVEQTRARTHELVDGLSEEELQATRTIEDGSWLQKPELTLEEILWTVFTHEQWHRGELLAAFWSRDVEPPRVDWHQFATPVGGVGHRGEDRPETGP